MPILSPEEPRKPQKIPHSLILENRNTLTATGVSNVDSFDEQTVVACTSLGELTIRGEHLNINTLNMETGELTLEGEIDSMSYADADSATGGFFSKLFK